MPEEQLRGRARAQTFAAGDVERPVAIPPRSPLPRPAMDPATPPKLQLPPRGTSGSNARQDRAAFLSSSAPGHNHYLMAQARIVAEDFEENGEESPHSPGAFGGSAAPQGLLASFAEEDDGGVFALDDEDDDEDDEEVPEESAGALDFGLSMEEYDQAEMTGRAARRDSSPLGRSLTRDLPRSMTRSMTHDDGEFLGTSFTGSPRLQNALQMLHSQCRSRAGTTDETADRFDLDTFGSPPKA